MARVKMRSVWQGTRWGDVQGTRTTVTVEMKCEEKAPTPPLGQAGSAPGVPKAAHNLC